MNTQSHSVKLDFIPRSHLNVVRRRCHQGVDVVSTNQIPEPIYLPTRTCCDCDDIFIPRTDRQIRCVRCQVESDFG